jgi:hypothetical protein
MLNEKGNIRMSIFTKSILITYLCIVSASLGLCETVGQSKKLSTTNDLPHVKLSEEQLSKIMSLIATNFISLLEKEIEAECLPIARRLHDYPTDIDRQECLKSRGMTSEDIRAKLRDKLLPFFWGEEYAPRVLESQRSYVELMQMNAVLGWFGSGSDRDPNISYETALETAKPSLQIAHAILSSHFKAKMYEEVSNILLEQLKDKDKFDFNHIDNAIKLIEQDKKNVPKAVPSDGDKK